MKTIAFFDFDGTITKKDSFIEFIRFVHGDIKFLFGFTLMLPMLILYKIKVIPNDVAKEKVIAYFFKGMKKVDFKKLANNYSLTCIDLIVKKSALDRLLWHKKQGHGIVIVSASIDCWLRPWCEEKEFKLISTQLEFKDEILTGKLKSKNCYGQEKVDRIKKLYDLEKFDTIYAYGDSSGDKEMLDIAHKKHYRYFES